MSGPAAEKWAGPIYLDASAVVKLFVPEPDSDDLNEALVGAEDVILSDLALTETASALGRRAREGLLASPESTRLHREAAKLAASCRRAELTPPVHRRAERLLLTSRETPLRALDALHIALALDADAATLVTYDPRLRAAAVMHGLFVAPESPQEPPP
ncbi:MAG TPA: type II toxin-antitoxin system VapC family toxin [Vicinamibacteria bacterium]|nr:type II toxin-antitoxin system VapC family toxin [Vicinamibacteria bacterium]